MKISCFAHENNLFFLSKQVKSRGKISYFESRDNRFPFNLFDLRQENRLFTRFSAKMFAGYRKAAYIRGVKRQLG